MRYIYPNLKPAAKRQWHPLALTAASALIVFSVAATASVLGFQPLAITQCAGSQESHHQIIGKHATGDASLNAPASDSETNLELNMPSVQLNTSDDAFKAPLVRA